MITVRRASRAWLAAVAGIVALGAAGGVAHAAAPLKGTGRPEAIPGKYVVVMKRAASGDDRARAKAAALARGGRVTHEFGAALNGYSAALPAKALAAVRDDPDVAYVEADAVMSVAGTQNAAPWGLDRIDQASLPLDGAYYFTPTGANVKAYVIDSGIRFSHTEFGGRAVTGTDLIDGGAADDCLGHGTMVAGLLGGATRGVAKGVTLVAVRVFGCVPEGVVSDAVAGVNWVTADHAAGQPAVANMSLGAPAYDMLDDAVRNSIADGVTYVVSAGNDGVNACDVSPARTAQALTVGATNSSDARWTTPPYSSNVGACLDLFAPGQDITSSWYTSDVATATSSGTSLASPYVAGAAALYLQANPAATPATVANALTSRATVGKVLDAGAGSPNRLLYAQVSGSQLGAPASVAATRNADGRLELFSTSSNGDVFHRAQSAPGGGWASWGQFDGQLTHLAAVTNVDGRLELFGTNQYGQIWRRSQNTPGGSWSSWIPLAGQMTNITAARNADGRLELFGTNQYGQIWRSSQTTPGASSWTSWTLLSGQLTNIAAARNADGRLKLIGTNQYGQIWDSSQTTPGASSWTSWTLLGGQLSNIAATANTDGRLELFGSNQYGQIWDSSQTTPGGSWSGWTLLSGQLTNIAATANTDGRLELIGSNQYGQVWDSSQTTPGGIWTGWTLLGGYPGG